MDTLNRVGVVPQDPITTGIKAATPGIKAFSSGLKAASSGVSHGVSSAIHSGKSIRKRALELLTPIRMWYIFLVVLCITIVILIVLGIKRAYTSNNTLATPHNIAVIKGQQTRELETRWIGSKQTRSGLKTVAATIPVDQRLLINFSVFSTRLAGFSGPYVSGVFNEDVSVRAALSSGARCIVLEIGRLYDRYEPILIYRDGWGIKSSLNVGSIGNVAKSIAARAFNPSSEGAPPAAATDPLFVVLYFADTPDPVKNPLEMIRFMAKVSEQLQPFANLIVGQTPQGDFRRQAMESQLFFTDVSLFSQKIILLTNADTTPFRKLESYRMSGEIKTEQDLDYLVHARLYSRESPSGLGITTSPLTNTTPAAVITTPNYWLNTPPDRLAEAQSNTKKAWTILMTPTANPGNGVPSKAVLTSLLTTYGVQSIPICLFDSPATTNLFTAADGPYTSSIWNAKPELIRFIPPKPIVVQKPIPETDSNGGAIASPSF